MCEHADPPCPYEYDSRISEPLCEETADLGVSIVFVVESRLVQKVLMNGKVVTETEPMVVMRQLPAAVCVEDDVPF